MRNISEYEFTEKYHLYKPMIYSIALNYLHNQSDSEDVCQDVFMKYLNSNQEFASLDNEKYWLIRVAINTSITYSKSSWKKKVELDDDKIGMIKDSDNIDIDMIEAIRKLKNKYKEVIILYYYENIEIKEIANILNISTDNVKKRLERARKEIKEALNE